MALYEDILSAIDNYQPSGDQRSPAEISLKITPQIQPSDVGGASSSGLGGGGLTSTSTQQRTLTGESNSAGTLAPSGFGGGGASLVPEANRLGRNPTLASVPSGKYTDSIFEAAIAGLRQQTQSAFLDVLRQLGFVDDQGNFIPGLVETEAARKRDELQFGRSEAQRLVNEQAQRGGTIFSGRRAQNLATAADPYERQLTSLEGAVPQQLAQLYQQATDLLRQFEVGQQMFLAEAAKRRADEELQRQLIAALSGTGAAETGGGGGAPTTTAGIGHNPQAVPSAGYRSGIAGGGQTWQQIPLAVIEAGAGRPRAGLYGGL